MIARPSWHVLPRVALVLTAVALPALAPPAFGWFRPNGCARVAVLGHDRSRAVGMVSAWVAGLLVDSLTGLLGRTH